MGVSFSIWRIKFWIWWHKYLDFTKNARNRRFFQRRQRYSVRFLWMVVINTF